FGLFFRGTIIFSRDYFKNCFPPEISIASKLKHVIQILIKFIQDIGSIYVGVGKRYLSEIKMLRGI
ncbi:MAG: hypothetical protein DRP38_01635, partial [Thermotogae bacterium]